MSNKNNIKIPLAVRKEIKNIINNYIKIHAGFLTTAENFYNSIRKSKDLEPYIHSVKFRVKDPNHLKAKLERKAREEIIIRKKFSINKNNYQLKITDLIGVRILHLHTRQFEFIKLKLEDFFAKEKYIVKEGPIAKTWDDEYRDIFKGYSVKTTKSNSMYTSVHYVIALNNREETRIELQVRTLFEEVWGEVSHKIDYPLPTKSTATKEQLKVLARLSSSGTRLVDSIFESLSEFENSLNKK